MTRILMQFSGGVARCLWSDAIPLAELGTLQVERASTVEFNNVSQCWVVRFADTGMSASGFSSRQQALDWEKKTLEQQMMQSR